MQKNCRYLYVFKKGRIEEAPLSKKKKFYQVSIPQQKLIKIYF